MALRSALRDLATQFANDVLDAIKGASLEEILGDAGGNGRRAAVGPTPDVGRSSTRVARGGRLRRRSSEDITKALDNVVTLVKKSKDGLRAEQIREQLGMQSKEMPRILKEGLAKRRLKSK